MLKTHRVPGHEHASIGYALDAGASIVVPQVETVEQARHVVSAMKYGMVRLISTLPLSCVCERRG